MQNNRRRKREYLYAGLVVVHTRPSYTGACYICLYGGRHEERRFS